mmetsp:Transcript_18332/g.36012  ORF Transcript_18332/g.36012 Transcript_18332/m.36012 type:complete len:849 (-) Transcript_18332:772-3318(-)|eukprot:CAMPEP_0171508102 /NCGR_PEP_ID=MMETSP0958-20121227/13968_1 /TAXON_ID=87120 /ORGANISM="Aurantiochytrium limacinum, Strain ATCCMYA-1381" /LENGTH=848 /DNA_ID=CAMNT_0012045073 /DNA_START=748 /DNA_END=3294 /DNA_ORIENTATION=-
MEHIDSNQGVGRDQEVKGIWGDDEKTRTSINTASSESSSPPLSSSFAAAAGTTSTTTATPGNTFVSPLPFAAPLTLGQDKEKPIDSISTAASAGTPVPPGSASTIVENKLAPEFPLRSVSATTNAGSVSSSVTDIDKSKLTSEEVISKHLEEQHKKQESSPPQKLDSTVATASTSESTSLATATTAQDKSEEAAKTKKASMDHSITGGSTNFMSESGTFNTHTPGTSVQSLSVFTRPSVSDYGNMNSGGLYAPQTHSASGVNNGTHLGEASHAMSAPSNLKRKASDMTPDPVVDTANLQQQKPADPAANVAEDGLTDLQRRMQENSLVYGCDACQKQPLHNVRYHCKICEDFDLCQECFESPVPKHDPTHLKFMTRVPIAFVPARWTPLPGSGITSVQTTVEAPPVQKPTTEQSFTGFANPVKANNAPSNNGTNTSKSSNFYNQAQPTVETDKDNFGGSTVGSASKSGARIAKRVKTGKDSPKLPRRSSLGGNTIAGQSMDKMNEELQACNLQPVTAGRLSTKASSNFMNIMTAGWIKFAHEYSGGVPGARVSKDSIFAQTLAINAMYLAGIPPARVSKEFEQDYSTLDETRAMLSAVVDQLMEADEDEWFCSPVPKDEPGYYDTIKEPMDLQTISENLAENDSYEMNSPEALYIAVTRDIFLIWQNAMMFNPSAHPVHARAAVLAAQSVEVLSQTARQLGLTIPEAALTFKFRTKTPSAATTASVKPGANSFSAQGSQLKIRRKQRPLDIDANYQPDHHNGSGGGNSSSGFVKDEDYGTDFLPTGNGTNRRPGSARSRVSRTSSTDAEVARLQAELQRANARIDSLMEIVEEGLMGMRARVTSLRNK